MLSLTQFNGADRARAAAAVQPCLDVDRWVDVVVDKRPYLDVHAVLEVSRRVADSFTDDKLTAADQLRQISILRLQGVFG